MAAGLDFMTRYHIEKVDLFDCTVTGEEKWVHHFTIEMKSASKQWVLKGNEYSVKVKRERSVEKILLAAF